LCVFGTDAHRPFFDHAIRTGAFDCYHIAARVRAAERVELVLPETAFAIAVADSFGK
jgi:hypothetical protein